MLAALKRYSEPLLMLSLLVAVIVALEVVGATSRTFLDEPARYSVEDHQEAVDLFAEKDIRGRVFVVVSDEFRLPEVGLRATANPLDRSSSTHEVTPANFEAELIYRGIARRLIVVVPDDRWDEARTFASMYAGARRHGQTWTLRFYGTPVTLTRAKDLRLPEERVVVWSQDRLNASFDGSLMESLTRTGVYDIMVAQKGG